MIYSTEVKNMCPVTQGVHHGAAPIPEEAKWVQSKEIKDISGYTHGIGWCAPQQGGCKLSLNVKEGVIPTGVILSVAPWVIAGIVIIAGVVFFAIRSRKKYEE